MGEVDNFARETPLVIGIPVMKELNPPISHTLRLKETRAMYNPSRK